MSNILFEHPLVEAITGWDFADGAWLGAPSGIIRKDNSLKPAYHELKRLIHEEWHTEKEITSDEAGIINLDGFKGIYELQIGGKKVNYNLDSNSKEDIVNLTIE